MSPKFYRNSVGCLVLFICLVNFPSWDQSWGQQAPPPPTGTIPGNETVNKPAEKQGETADAPPETKISPEESEQLFRSVDEIMKFASDDTGLPIKHPVKRRLVTRDEVTAYIQKRMAEDQDAQRLQRSELLLKKFGLLPQNFDMQKFLVALLREQVAGYYDPQTKTVNLLDWVSPEAQRPVLAHELTHALQDQMLDLESFMKAGDADLATQTAEPSLADIANDEAQTARQAVVEGQAMAVLVDYMLKPAGQTLLNSPEMVAALKQGMLVGTADSPQFQSAPVFLKESLTFPYRYGLDFVADLLVNRGKKSYAEALQSPPQTSREIMEPETYREQLKIAPLPLPDFTTILANYERFDVGAMGEFDVAALIDQYADADTSRAMYPHWRGGYYYAVRPRKDAAGQLGFMYLSRWSDAAPAARFAAIYAESVTHRYQHAHALSGEDPATKTDSAKSLSLAHSWLTESGPVTIDQRGDLVLITESLDQASTQKLTSAVFPAPTQPGSSSPAQAPGQR
jgi:hypothetical protein